MAILTVEPRHKSRSVGDLVVARVGGGVGAAVDHAEVGVQVEVPSGADGIAQTLGGSEENHTISKLMQSCSLGKKR